MGGGLRSDPEQRAPSLRADNPVDEQAVTALEGQDGVLGDGVKATVDTNV